MHSFAGILLERSTPTRIPMKGYRTMIGHIISQGIRLGAVVTVAESSRSCYQARGAQSRHICGRRHTR